MTKHTAGGGGVDGGERHVSKRDKQREARKRRSGVSGGRLALFLAVVGVVLIVVFVVPRGQGKSVEPLPRSPFTTSAPINTADPTSGKPVVPGITSEYKGYTVGHCCGPSKGDWEALSVERKETFIRSYLR